MEKVMSRMFDYQRFEQDSALQSVIDEVHSRWLKRELSMDEMEMLSAAGNSQKNEKNPLFISTAGTSQNNEKKPMFKVERKA